MKRVLRRAAVAALALAVIGALAVAAWRLSRPTPPVIQGQIEATEVNVSAKIAGRVAALLVREGDKLSRGTLVATLDSPEVRARMDQATAARSAADAQRLKADRGAREEEIRQAENAWQRARHATELAEKTWERIDRLARDGVVPVQRRDEADAQRKTARDGEAMAKAAYDMAMAGAREEDKMAAAAQVDRATGAVAEVRAALDETRLVAPADGEVYRRNVEPGEIVPAGYPLVTLLRNDDVWATFELREDVLPRFGVGASFSAAIPALGNRRATFVVYYVAPAGDFATWRPTGSLGGFDVKTFEVRARPASPLAGLRPGMSVIVADEHTSASRGNGA